MLFFLVRFHDLLYSTFYGLCSFHLFSKNVTFESTRLLGAKYMETFGCMSMPFGCMSMPFGCMYAATFGCMYAVVGCKVCGNVWVHVCGSWVQVS